jgi:hypothetical protein
MDPPGMRFLFFWNQIDDAATENHVFKFFPLIRSQTGQQFGCSFRTVIRKIDVRKSGDNVIVVTSSDVCIITVFSHSLEYADHVIPDSRISGVGL